MGTKVFASAVNFTAVTPSDSTLHNFHALYIGTGGDVALATETGTAVVFANVANGSILPVAMRSGRVMNTSTTASGIIALSW